MKGFFSFVLLFSLIILITHSLFYSNLMSNYSNSKLISIERIYSLEMNLKEVIIGGTREGSIEGLELYLLTTPTKKFNLDEAKQTIKISVHKKLSSLNDLQLEDFKFKLWCGDPTSNSLTLLRKKMLIENKLLLCSNCIELAGLNCIDYIEPKFHLNVEPGELPPISSTKLGTDEGFFGISIYSSKFSISSAFLIPKYEVMLIE